ncbi:uncharacterized protein LOC143466113 [Clavelina lepadiformis]|uniref:uncharacterized protein LOC143466113 n=1 Tax=Clavelina lepadiformis TaxID=159417 RepID=UPI0040418B43
MASSSRRAPSPPKVPPAKLVKDVEEKLQKMNGSVHGNEHPPQYSFADCVPFVPKPFISGYLDKRVGDDGTKNITWARKFVEVSQGTLKFFNSKEEREDSGTGITLADSFVYIEQKRNIRLETKSGIRVFRAPNDLRALQWAHVISRFCMVTPTAEGFTKKLSGGKAIREDRYIRLNAEGILSWYKSDTDSEPRGSIQVRGERVSLDVNEIRTIYIETKERCYLFEFIDLYETNLWFAVLDWHSHRSPIKGPLAASIRIRNK